MRIWDRAPAGTRVLRRRDVDLRLPKLIAALPLIASSFAADAESLTRLSLEFGQPRTLLWSVLEEKPAGAEEFAFRLADQLALNPDRKRWPYLSGASLTFTPLLKYDRNVNNGFEGDTIYIGDAPWVLDEDQRAVEAATIGGALAGGLSFGIAQGTTLSLSGRFEYRRAIGKEFEVFDNTASVNLGYTAQDWTYLNAGFLVNEEKRALAEDNVRIASFSIGRLFGEAGNQLHDISGTYIRAEENSTWQSRARVDWTGTFVNYGVFRLGLERGEKIDGSVLPEITISTSYSNVIFGSPTTLSAYYTRETGSDNYGPREVDLYKIRIDRAISDRVSLYMSYERKDSTLDSFDNSGVDFGLNITGFKF